MERREGKASAMSTRLTSTVSPVSPAGAETSVAPGNLIGWSSGGPSGRKVGGVTWLGAASCAMAEAGPISAPIDAAQKMRPPGFAMGRTTTRYERTPIATKPSAGAEILEVTGVNSHA